MKQSYQSITDLRQEENIARSNNIYFPQNEVHKICLLKHELKLSTRYKNGFVNI